MTALLCYGNLKAQTQSETTSKANFTNIEKVKVVQNHLP